MTVRKDGAQEEQVARVDQQTKKLDPEIGSVVSGGQTQSQIDSLMEDLLHKYSLLFSSDGKIGRATDVKLVHLEIDAAMKPIQQKCRPIPLQYVDRFKKLLDDLEANGVVSGPLGSEWATGWIHNPVIAD